MENAKRSSNISVGLMLDHGYVWMFTKLYKTTNYSIRVSGWTTQHSFWISRTIWQVLVVLVYVFIVLPMFSR